MGCKDYALRECEGRNGHIVCDIDGEDHEPDYTCDDYEQESDENPPDWRLRQSRK